jgi:hypothetical protein
MSRVCGWDAWREQAGWARSVAAGSIDDGGSSKSPPGGSDRGRPRVLTIAHKIPLFPTFNTVFARHMSLWA